MRVAPVPIGRPPEVRPGASRHASVAVTLDTYSHMLRAMGDQTARAVQNAALSCGRRALLERVVLGYGFATPLLVVLRSVGHDGSFDGASH
jgi:hypothetical protein